MQRNDELQAAGLPADFFKEERERRQAQAEREEATMAAKRRAEREAMAGPKPPPLTQYSWIGGRPSRRTVERAATRGR